MIVYHASYQYFKQPNLKYAKSYRDFGKGFYVTEHYLDALSILKNKSGYIYKYELDINQLNILNVNNKEVLNIIIQFRTKKDCFNNDIIIGPTASGKISKLFKNLRNNKNCLDEIKKEIKFDIYKNQICLKTNQAINQLKLLEIEDIYE